MGGTAVLLLSVYSVGRDILPPLLLQHRQEAILVITPQGFLTRQHGLLLAFCPAFDVAAGQGQGAQSKRDLEQHQDERWRSPESTQGKLALEA